MDGQSACELFSQYLSMVGTPRLAFDEGPEDLKGKAIGIVNSGAWMTLWGYYFSRKYLPGVKIVSVGNEAVQLNFMRAHSLGEKCPPQRNIDLFREYSEQLVELAGVDAVIITCSTMNRCFGTVKRAMDGLGVPAVQIDEPMMRRAVHGGGKILVVATHGPTVNSTRQLLLETAQASGLAKPDFCGVTVEAAFDLLGRGDIEGHNRLIAQAIRKAVREQGITQVVLAQLSMSVFAMRYPDPVKEFGVPVLNSGDCGFEHMRGVLQSVRVRR